VPTQDVYAIVARNWILPRWGQLLLEEVKTVEVERWLRATDLANGTKAKIKNVMTALFSHAVRWEFCGRKPTLRYIVQDDEEDRIVSFLGTVDLNTKIRPSDTGKILEIRYEGKDKQTEPGKNPIKRFKVSAQKDK